MMSEMFCTGAGERYTGAGDDLACCQRPAYRRRCRDSEESFRSVADAKAARCTGGIQPSRMKWCKAKKDEVNENNQKSNCSDVHRRNSDFGRAGDEREPAGLFPVPGYPAGSRPPVLVLLPGSVHRSVGVLG